MVIQIKKTDLVETIVYGCIINKLDKELIKDISINKEHNILKEHDIKPYVSECSIGIKD